jgi:DNA-binding GntR family transcriptional regulator
MDEETIAQVLTAALLAGRLAPGLRLGEQQLADTFGVSRERVRKVLQRLANKRLIDLLPNRGAFVAQPGLKEAREVYEARRMLEGGVVSHLAVTITDRQYKTLLRHADMEAAAIGAQDHAEAVRLSGLFHSLLAEMTANAYIIRYMHELVSRTAMLVAYHETGSPQCGCAEHRSILAAIAEHDSERATREMRTHLSLIETRLQAPAVRPTTSDLDAVLHEELSRLDGSTGSRSAPEQPGHGASRRQLRA